MFDSLVSRTLEVFLPDTFPLVGFIELQDPCLGGPFGTGTRERCIESAEIDAIAPLVRSRIFCELDPAVRHNLFNNPGKIENPIVFPVTSDIECLVMDRIPAGVKNGEKSSRDVLDVDHGTPGSSIAFEINDP
jgi:hypothetical protein